MSVITISPETCHVMDLVISLVVREAKVDARHVADHIDALTRN